MRGRCSGAGKRRRGRVWGRARDTDSVSARAVPTLNPKYTCDEASSSNGDHDGVDILDLLEDL
jgi:hypothetical protein